MDESKNPIPAEPPAWLGEAQRLSRAFAAFIAEPASEPAFDSRCQEAASQALALARMRKERRKAGFLPVSLTTALAEWARAARVDLDSLLAAWGVASLDHSVPREVRPLAGLCRRLGLSWREAWLHLGIGVVERHGGFMPLVLTRPQGPGRRHDLLTAGEEAVRAALGEIGPAAVAEWATLSTELSAAYDSTSI